MNFYYSWKYNFEFLKHTGKAGHVVGKDELRLREVILQNFRKSLVLCNLVAFYVNYRRKNKSVIKSFLSIIFLK
jgi:hypothetical protein